MFCYKKILFCALLLIGFLWSCKTPPPPEKDFTKLEWLLGTWEVNEGNEYETWTKLNDTTFYGRNFKVYHETDTLITRNAHLVKKENDFFFLPIIKTPQGDKEIYYKMISDSDSYFIFENPQHSFPNKITYTIVNETNVTTKQEGKNRKIEYNYKRLK